MFIKIDEERWSRRRYPEIVCSKADVWAWKMTASPLAAAPAGVTARSKRRGWGRAPSASGGLGKWQPGGMSL